MATQKYYKAVQVFDNPLGRCFYSGYIVHKELRTEYFLNKWTYPKLQHSKLFVFTEEQSAIIWAQTYGCNVYECEVKKPSKYGVFISSTIGTYILKAWKYRKQKKKYTNLSTFLSKNMVFVDAVKLTKQIMPLN